MHSIMAFALLQWMLRVGTELQEGRSPGTGWAPLVYIVVVSYFNVCFKLKFAMS